MAKRYFAADFGGAGIIRFFPAAANEEHVADLDVAALRCGADINALVFTALVELLPGNGVVVVWVVIDALLVRVASIVEKDAAAGYAMLGPVVDRAFVVCGRTYDVGTFCLLLILEACKCYAMRITYAIVESTRWQVRELFS